MKFKPKHWSSTYADVFKDKSVVELYKYRPSYPLETFGILKSLIPNGSGPTKVLDAGCGTGFIARELVNYVDQIDAVDISEEMISYGKKHVGSYNGKINWICKPIEEIYTSTQYDLIVAAASLHWMQWEIVFPIFQRILKKDACLAIVGNMKEDGPWRSEVGPIISTFSMNRHYRSYTMETLSKELINKGLFQQLGRKETQYIPFKQPISDWIQALHARNGFSRDRMDPDDAKKCDQQLKEVLFKYFPNGIIERKIKGLVIWGKPLKP